MHYNTFLFDIDGTITDSTAAILHSLQDLLLFETHHRYTTEELLFALGLPNTELGRYLGISNWGDLLEKNGQKYYEKYVGTITIFPEMEETLELLKAAGCRLGIATSKTRRQFLCGFNRLPCAKLFDCIICADDTQFHKPHPAPLITCMAGLGGTIPDSIYIGDSQNDMLCAANAGIKSGLALWGCRKVKGVKADYYIRKPSDLLIFVPKNL